MATTNSMIQELPAAAARSSDSVTQMSAKTVTKGMRLAGFYTALSILATTTTVAIRARISNINRHKRYQLSARGRELIRPQNRPHRDGNSWFGGGQTVSKEVSRPVSYNYDLPEDDEFFG